MAQLKFQVYKVIAHLQNKEPVTKYDLAEELSMHQRTAQRHLTELWTLDLIHICAWDREHNTPIPVYRWGIGKPDVPKPDPLTPTAKTRRYKEKMRDDNRRAN